jgi:hypothetical protein
LLLKVIYKATALQPTINYRFMNHFLIYVHKFGKKQTPPISYYPRTVNFWQHAPNLIGSVHRVSFHGDRPQINVSKTIKTHASDETIWLLSHVLRIHQVSSSYLDSEADHFDRGSSWFSSVPTDKCRDSTLIQVKAASV